MLPKNSRKAAQAPRAYPHISPATCTQPTQLEMDVIILKSPRGVLYRAQGAHAFCAGEGRVLSVRTVEMLKPPYPRRGVRIGNVSGRFTAGFDTRAFKSVVLRCE